MCADVLCCVIVCGRKQTAAEIKEGKQRTIKLVVDGYALLYYLYFSNNFNCVCGGQYAQFAEFTKAYVNNLLKCGFSPFVVMDGTLVVGDDPIS